MYCKEKFDVGWYNLQWSTDLRQWRTLSSFYLDGPSFSFIDTNGLPTAFYRAVQVPPPNP